MKKEMCTCWQSRAIQCLKVLVKLVTVQLLFTFALKAQQPEPLSRTTYLAMDLSVGGGVVENSYLTPLRYGGTRYGLHLVVESPLTERHPLFLRLASDLSYLSSVNPSKSALLEQTRYVFQGEAHYIFSLPYSFKLSLGGGLRGLIGGNALPSNVNNTTSFDAKLDLVGSVQLAYMLPLQLFPATFRLYANYGVIGLAHHVGYNQSYFEVDSQDGGLARTLHFTHLGNASQSALLFSIDMPIANCCTLRIGYCLDWDRLYLERRASSVFTQGAFVGFSFDTLWFAGRAAVQSKQHRPVLFSN